MGRSPMQASDLAGRVDGRRLAAPVDVPIAPLKAKQRYA
jgi:hypothetical protein